MGWASGSMLAESLWVRVRDHVPEDSRRGIAEAFISEFESFDCDTLDEAERLMEDAGYYVGPSSWIDEDEIDALKGDRITVTVDGEARDFDVLESCIVVGMTPDWQPLLSGDHGRWYLATKELKHAG